MKGEIAELFFQAVLGRTRDAGVLSDEQLAVDGTLVEAWAGHKSFHPRQDEWGGRDGARTAECDFHGERLRNGTPTSTTDPEARPFQKGSGKEAKLSFMGDVITEDRNGLLFATETRLATGAAGREASVKMTKRVKDGRRPNLGGDK